MNATETPPRLRVRPDVLSVVVTAYAAMVDALGPLWTCQHFADGTHAAADVPPYRPILHGLDVRWTDHAVSDGGWHIYWEADVTGEAKS